MRNRPNWNQPHECEKEAKYDLLNCRKELSCLRIRATYGWSNMVGDARSSH